MEKAEDIKGIESSLGNLGSVYFYKGSLDKAEEKFVGLELSVYYSLLLVHDI